MTRPTPRRTLIPAAIVTMIVVGGLAAIIANPFNGTDVATGAPADSLVSDSLLPDSTITIESPVVIGDSGAPSVQKGGRPRQPVSRFGSLRISAPISADVTVDGTLLGKGEVRKDSLTPGQHLVVAEIPSFQGCSVNRETRLITVSAGSSQPITMSPRACGTLMFKAAGARADGSRVDGLTIWYSVQPEGGDIPKDELMPLQAPLVLPAGRYTLRLSTQRCVPYNEPNIELAPGETKNLATIILTC